MSFWEPDDSEYKCPFCGEYIDDGYYEHICPKKPKKQLKLNFIKLIITGNKMNL